MYIIQNMWFLFWWISPTSPIFRCKSIRILRILILAFEVYCAYTCIVPIMYLFLLHLFFIFRMLCMKSVYIPIVINNTFLSWTFQKWKRSAIKINTFFVGYKWMHNKPQKLKSTFLEFLFIWKKHRFQPFWKNNYIAPQIPLFLIIQSSVLYVHVCKRV